MRLFFTQKYSVLDNKGQTLIEAIVTIAIAFVIIGSIVALVNASNRRATLARQATQASKLAQGGMEIVRNIRDQDHDDAVRVGNPICSVAPFCSWADLFTADQIDPTIACLSFSGAPDNQWRLLTATRVRHAACESTTLLDQYERVVEFRDDDISATVPGAGDEICSTADLSDENVKRVTVRVRWQSPLGAQERTVVSCLSRWR